MAAACAGALIADVLDGLGACASARQRLGEGGVQLGSAVAIEQLDQPDGVMTDSAATMGERTEEGVGVLARMAQAITTAQFARSALVLRERAQVRGVLDAPAAVVAAGMPRDLGAAVEHPHLVLARDERQRLAQQLRRDGVIVAVEMDVRLLAARYGHDEVAVEAVRGQLQKRRLLSAQRAFDGRLVRVAFASTKLPVASRLGVSPPGLFFFRHTPAAPSPISPASRPNFDGLRRPLTVDELDADAFADCAAISARSL